VAAGKPALPQHTQCCASSPYSLLQYWGGSHWRKYL